MQRPMPAAARAQTVSDCGAGKDRWLVPDHIHRAQVRPDLCRCALSDRRQAGELRARQRSGRSDWRERRRLDKDFSAQRPAHTSSGRRGDGTGALGYTKGCLVLRRGAGLSLRLAPGHGRICVLRSGGTTAEQVHPGHWLIHWHRAARRCHSAPRLAVTEHSAPEWQAAVRARRHSHSSAGSR